MNLCKFNKNKCQKDDRSAKTNFWDGLLNLPRDFRDQNDDENVVIMNKNRGYFLKNNNFNSKLNLPSKQRKRR